jgi:uncharacterized membrane protein YesL
VWAIINLTGLVMAVIGMFGITELLVFQHAMTVFVSGTVLTFVSMVAIFRKAYTTDGIRTSEECDVGASDEDGDKQ